MIPTTMIPDFAQEIRDILQQSGFLLKDETGKYRYPEVYEHTLPPPSKKNPPRVPWLLVSLYNGEQQSADDPRRVTVHITCTTIDDTENMQGYMDAMNLLERVCQHFYGKTIIAGRYMVVYPYQFAVMDDTRYPYYSAGLAVRVEMPGTTPKNIDGGYAV